MIGSVSYINQKAELAYVSGSLLESPGKSHRGLRMDTNLHRYYPHHQCLQTLAKWSSRQFECFAASAQREEVFWVDGFWTFYS